MAVDLTLPGLVDIRQPILGDSFGWEGVEPPAAKKVVDFHHSGSDAPTEDGFTIADYHVNHNGWGGIGYNFVITRPDYPGRAPFTQPGAQIQYVGDLATWRAHVKNNNPGHVGVCFVGLEPTREQLELGRRLMDFLVAPNNILPSINYGNQATVHKLDKDPQSPTGLQQTDCPGNTYPEWLPYIQGGSEPSSWIPVPPPIEQAPPPETPEQGKGGGEVPEYEATYSPLQEVKEVKRDGAVAVNVITGEVLEDSRPALAKGGTLASAGSFVYKGVKFYRSQYSATHGLWNGVDAQFFEEPNGQVPDAVLPVTVVEQTDEQKRAEFLGLSPETKVSLFDKIVEFIASLIAQLPLIKKDIK